jgi:sec-independent protein translocase protein TatA
MIFNTVLLGWLGMQEIVIILIIVLLLFGGKKIPELMKGFGKGMKEFKDATKEESKPETQGDPKSGEENHKK